MKNETSAIKELLINSGLELKKLCHECMCRSVDLIAKHFRSQL